MPDDSGTMNDIQVDQLVHSVLNWSIKWKNLHLKKDLLRTYIDRLISSVSIKWRYGWTHIVVDGDSHEVNDFFEELFMQFSGQPGAIIGEARDHSSWGRERPEHDVTKKKMFQLIFRVLKANIGKRYSVEDIAEALDITSTYDPILDRNKYLSNTKRIRRMIRECVKHYPHSHAALIDRRKVFWFDR